MAMQYCFELNGRKVCFDLPVLYDRYWWIKPQPEPWAVFGTSKPDPTPWQVDQWIKDESLKPAVREELLALAAIEQCAKQLSGQNKDMFIGALQKAVKQLDLPKDVAIEFG